MVLSNRESSLARPHLLHTEYGFHIDFMEKGILKLQEMFDGDSTVVSKIIALSNRYSTWRDKTSSSPSIDSSSTPSTRASRNSSKSLIAILRSDQKLWPFRTVTQACHDETSSSPSIHSSSTPSTRASGNSSKSLIAILRSDQKLWPFRTVYQAWRDHTSSTPSMDSTSTSWKKAS